MLPAPFLDSPFGASMGCRLGKPCDRLKKQATKRPEPWMKRSQTPPKRGRQRGTAQVEPSRRRVFLGYAIEWEDGTDVALMGVGIARVMAALTYMLSSHVCPGPSG